MSDSITISEDGKQQISLDALRTRKLFVATPMYGNPTAAYVQSFGALTVLCMQYGIRMLSAFLMNDSYIERARNLLCEQFLASDCSHLLFVDQDIAFDAKSVMSLLAYQSEDSPYDILAGACPWKFIDWEQVRDAAKAGLADEDASFLRLAGTRYLFVGGNPVDFSMGDPVEVEKVGTGFMCIQRRVLERYPDTGHYFLENPPDMVGKPIRKFFDCSINIKGLFVSEDYAFCDNVRASGGRIWLHPQVRTKHIGTYDYG